MPDDPPSLKTDKRNETTGKPEPSEIHPFKPQAHPPDVKRVPHDASGKEVGKRISSPGTDCNCHGHTFGDGLWGINEQDVATILKDNYKKVEKGKARICNVVVYGVKGESYDHSGLVVEVDAQGNPKVIRSKWGPTGDVFDHPPDVKPYLNPDGTGDYETYERDPDQLDQATRDEIDRLEKAYKDIADPSSQEAHDAAAKLCQKKNALKK